MNLIYNTCHDYPLSDEHWFVTEWIEDKLVIDPKNPSQEFVPIAMVTVKLCTIYVDMACNSKCLRVGITIFTSTGGLIEKCISFAFPTTNNVVEYKELLVALYQLHSLEAKILLLYTDSHLIVNQVNNAFEIKEEIMKKYLEEIKEEISDFQAFEIKQVCHGGNTYAQSLASLATLVMMETK